VRVSHRDDVAHLLNNVLHDGRAFRVNDPFGATGQSVDLPLCVPARADRHDLLHTRHIFATAILDRLPKILQTDHRGAVIGATLVVRRCLEVLCQVGPEILAAREIGGDDAEDSPAALTALWIRALVIGGLLHQLAVDLVAELLILVTMLRIRHMIYASFNQTSSINLLYCLLIY